jgi:hypothetical protein
MYPMNGNNVAAAWLNALPADMQGMARQLCSAPPRLNNIEGIFVSEYAGNRKVLVIHTANRYEFLNHIDGRPTYTSPPDIHLQAREAGRVTIEAGFATLWPDKPTMQTYDGHLTSAWHEYRLWLSTLRKAPS